MSLCTQWSLVKHLPESRHARPLYCRSWRCDVCQPRRRSQLMAKCASGEPVRFLTLTVNPKVGESPYDRLRKLSGAWNVVVKRLRRLFPAKEVEYLAIVEATKAGEPHLHILLRAPFIPQGTLSEWMGELLDSPIVDIRKIRNMREVIRYVAKYVTKAPAQFGTAKRYWCSTGYSLGADTNEQTADFAGTRWSIDRRTLFEIISEWTWQGWATRHERGEQVVAFPGSHTVF